MLVRGGSGLWMWIYRSALVPFHIGSMFCFPASIHSTCHDVSDSQFWVAYDMCSVSVLQIILSFVKQQATTGITHLVNWLDSSTVCYR